jgi:hypothetical protein
MINKKPRTESQVVYFYLYFILFPDQVRGDDAADDGQNLAHDCRRTITPETMFLKLTS